MPDRVFVAIDLGERARASLAAATSALSRVDPAWTGEKPVAPALLHVTLAFVGPVPDAALDPLVERLRRAVRAVAAFELRLAGVRAMPSARRATMVWAVLDDPGSRAAALASGVSDATASPETSRPFRPHVTLVRARSPRRIASDALAAANAVLSDSGKEADRIVSVRSVTVYSSTLGASGPTYAPLATMPLAARVPSSRAD